MKLRSLAVAIIWLLALVASACAPSPSVQPAEDVAALDESTGAVSAPEGLPEYAYRSAQAARGYQIAIAEKELLSRLPCYCGCGQDAEHYRNLADCFYGSDGGFNSHAANCQICLEEAEDAAKWKGQGFSTREIRNRIDAGYEGRGNPTDTPPVL